MVYENAFIVLLGAHTSIYMHRYICVCVILWIADSDSVGLGWGQKFYMSNKFPWETIAPGSCTTVEGDVEHSHTGADMLWET